MWQSALLWIVRLSLIVQYFAILCNGCEYVAMRSWTVQTDGGDLRRWRKVSQI